LSENIKIESLQSSLVLEQLSTFSRGLNANHIKTRFLFHQNLPLVRRNTSVRSPSG